MSVIATICESSLSGLTQAELTDLIMSGHVVGHERTLFAVMVDIGFAKSRSQARAMIKQGGVNFGPDKTPAKENDAVIFLTRAETSSDN